jgi:hypothetical protein
MQTNTRRNYISELESLKAKQLAITLANSDASLTQLHVCLSNVHEAIETACSLEELKDALHAAIRTRRE